MHSQVDPAIPAQRSLLQNRSKSWPDLLTRTDIGCPKHWFEKLESALSHQLVSVIIEMHSIDDAYTGQCRRMKESRLDILAARTQCLFQGNQLPLRSKKYRRQMRFRLYGRR